MILETSDLPLQLPGVPLAGPAPYGQVHAEREGHVRCDQAVQVLVHLVNPAHHKGVHILPTQTCAAQIKLPKRFNAWKKQILLAGAN